MLAALGPVTRPGLDGPEIHARADVIAVLGDLGPGQVEALLGRRATAGHAVLLDTASWDPSRAPSHATTSAATLRRAGWHVTVATAGTEPDVVWAHLTAVATRTAS